MSALSESGHPALFLDRDGVINHDCGYVAAVDDFVFIDGIFELCRTAEQLGFRLVVVTNQSGVARGYFSLEDVVDLHTWMVERFAERGVTISGVYVSPYHPDGTVDDYRRACESRKPGPGMLLRAEREHRLDLARSVLIGDRISDLGAAHSAGLRRAYWLSEVHEDTGSNPLEGIEVIRVSDLAEVARDLARPIAI